MVAMPTHMERRVSKLYLYLPKGGCAACDACTGIDLGPMEEGWSCENQPSGAVLL